MSDPGLLITLLFLMILAFLVYRSNRQKPTNGGAGLPGARVATNHQHHGLTEPVAMTTQMAAMETNQ